MKKKRDCIIVQILTQLEEKTSLMKRRSEGGRRVVDSDQDHLLDFKVYLKTKKITGEGIKFHREE